MGVTDGNIVSYSVTVGTIKGWVDGRYYIYVGNEVSGIGNYLIGYYILKDI